MTAPVGYDSRMLNPPTGAVVQIRKGQEVVLGRVMGRKNERLLYVLGDDERMHRVAPKRILQIAGLIAEEEREAVLEALRRLRVAALESAEVDLELLWSQVRDDKAGAEIPVLCRIYLGSSGTVEERLGFGFALCADRVWFRQEGERFVPRMESEVAARRERIEQERRETERRERFVTWAREVLSAKATRQSAPERPQDIDPELALLERLAVRREESGQAAKQAKRLLEEIAAGLPKGTRLEASPDGAFELLVALGEFDPHENLSLRRLEVPQGFSPELEKAACALAPYRFDPRVEPEREDLRSLEVITIDGADTTDRDDALSLEPIPGREGRWRLGVHIADVAWWVAPGSALDREALRRATSIYLADRTIPMFPAALAEKRLSLDAGDVRPAISFLVEVDERAQVYDYRVVRSAIEVRRNLSYEEADALIVEGDRRLVGLVRIADALRERRLAAGAVVVPGRDRRVKAHGDGRVEVEVRDERTAANRLVAEAMILANALAAEVLQRADAPAIYRTQRLQENKRLDPSRFPCEEVYGYHLRRRLGRTELGTRPGRHATLGLDAYVQISSPIRRYQDLVMQRQLVAVLAGKPPVYDAQAVLEILGATEAATGDANQVSRETELYWLLVHLSRHRGRRFEAVALTPLKDRRLLFEIPALDLRTVIKARESIAPGTRAMLELVEAEPRRGTHQFRLVEVIERPGEKETAVSTADGRASRAATP